MLFNSWIFIFAFLPLSVIAYYLSQKLNVKLANMSLLIFSLAFYALWSVHHLFLLALSIIINYLLGQLIVRSCANKRTSLNVLILALVINLCGLCYYKYTNFFLENIGAASQNPINQLKIILPLGISFYTFTQIGFLVDAYRGKVLSFNFLHYCLFVTYFPHLIAGPILHHKKMIDQFSVRKTQVLRIENVGIGLTYLVIGLSKKVLIADSFAKYSDPVFLSVSQGNSPTLFVAWLGALAFTFQIYFDFSAYSDMAIGMSRILGIYIPINFNSPYKAKNISEFWRRWHISLSSFLRDYLYIPLGGNRKGKYKSYLNLFIVMLLGGLWHGASWTFVVWGSLHGIFLMIHHFWLEKKKFKSNTRIFRRSQEIFSIFATFTVVVFAWVIFRSPNLRTAIDMLQGMLFLNGISLPHSFTAFSQNPLVQWMEPEFSGLFPRFEWINNFQLIFEFSVISLIVWRFPSAQELINSKKLTQISHQKIIVIGFLIGFIFIICISSLVSSVPFIYFQF